MVTYFSRKALLLGGVVLAIAVLAAMQVLSKNTVVTEVEAAAGSSAQLELGPGKTLELNGWSWGANNNGSSFDVQDFSISTEIGKLTPELIGTLVSGSRIGGAKLTVATSDGGSMRIDMQDVFITSVSLGGTGKSNLSSQNVTFNFQRATIKVFDRSGTELGAYNWDLNIIKK